MKMAPHPLGALVNKCAPLHGSVWKRTWLFFLSEVSAAPWKVTRVSFPPKRTWIIPASLSIKLDRSETRGRKCCITCRTFCRRSVAGATHLGDEKRCLNVSVEELVQDECRLTLHGVAGRTCWRATWKHSSKQSDVPLMPQLAMCSNPLGLPCRNWPYAVLTRA